MRIMKGDYMNRDFQRKRIKPNAKCCDWCRYIGEDFMCRFEGNQGQLTHRLLLKLIRENDFRYCKNYRYSKVNFKIYKNMCIDNATLTKF